MVMQNCWGKGGNSDLCENGEAIINRRVQRWRASWIRSVRQKASQSNSEMGGFFRQTHRVKPDVVNRKSYNRYQSLMKLDFRYRSIEIDEEKS